MSEGIDVKDSWFSGTWPCRGCLGVSYIYIYIYILYFLSAYLKSCRYKDQKPRRETKISYL